MFRKTVSCFFLTIILTLPVLGLAEAAKKSYSANYDLVLEVGDGSIHIQNGGKVSLNRVIPMDAGQHKVELSISKITAMSYIAEIAVFERVDDLWIQLVPERPTFRGNFGAPVEYSWQTKEIRLNLALVIGERREK